MLLCFDAPPVSPAVPANLNFWLRERGVEGEHRWRWEIVCCRYFSAHIWLCDRKHRNGNIMNAHFPIFLKARNKFLFVTPLSLYSRYFTSLSLRIFPIKILHRKSWKFVALSFFLSWGLSFTALLKVVEERYTTLLFFSRKKKNEKFKEWVENYCPLVEITNLFLDIFSWLLKEVQ